MASKTVYDALLAALRAVVEPTYPVIEWEQIDVQIEGQTTPFVSMEEAVGERRVIEFGNPNSQKARETGDVDIIIYVPAKSGFGIARTIGQTISDGLQYRVLQPTNPRINSAHPPAPYFVAEGRWSAMRLTIEYEYDFDAQTYVS